MTRIARSIERLLLIGGGALLAFWAAAFLHQRALASWDRASFDRSRSPYVRAPRSIPQAPARAREGSAGGLAAYAPRPAERLALLQISAIDLEVVVLQGTDGSTLNRGVGRIEGTAAPGRTGNAGIAGHRDGFFRGLERVQVGDSIRVRVAGGTRPIAYRVEWIRVVGPQEVWVLDATDQPALTLVTCHPFRYVGPAPNRYVVRAVAVDAIAPES